MTTSDLDTRYGRRRGLSQTQRYALTVVALLLGTLAAYFVFRNSEQQVQGVEVDHQVISSHQVIVVYEVHKPSAMTVTCVIRARNGAGAEVGRQSITISDHKSVVRGTFHLPTSDLAVTGEVEGCAKATGNG